MSEVTSATIRVLVPLAPGFEEMEAIIPVDIFRRAGWEVVTAGLDAVEITASRGTRHLCDTVLAEALPLTFDLIYLPGGLPGADHLAGTAPLLDALRAQAAADRWIAAICAAPKVLARAGLLDGKRFTLHPGSRDAVRPLQPLDERVVVDGRILTGMAAGVSFELAFEVLARLSGSAETGEAVNQGLFCPPVLV